MAITTTTHRHICVLPAVCQRVSDPLELESYRQLWVAVFVLELSLGPMEEHPMPLIWLSHLFRHLTFLPLCVWRQYFSVALAVLEFAL